MLPLVTVRLVSVVVGLNVIQHILEVPEHVLNLFEPPPVLGGTVLNLFEPPPRSRPHRPRSRQADR